MIKKEVKRRILTTVRTLSNGAEQIRREKRSKIYATFNVTHTLHVLQSSETWKSVRSCPGRLFGTIPYVVTNQAIIIYTVTYEVKGITTVSADRFYCQVEASLSHKQAESVDKHAVFSQSVL